MKHLYFMRHGLSVMNEAGLFSGQIETPLTEAGRAQARLAGEYARSLNLDYIVSSTYSRAKDTATIVAEIIAYPVQNIELSDLLIERHLGAMEGQPYNPLLDMDLHDVADIETVEALEDRVTRAWQHLQNIPANSVLVVSHGATGRMLRHIIDPSIPFIFENPLHKEKFRFANATIVKLV